MLITIRHHRTTTIPAATPNNMDLLRQHRIRSTHHRANIQVMLPILNRHMKIMAARIQVSNNCVHRPVTVLIHHVTAVALTQQLLIPMVTLGPRALPRAHTHLKTGSTLLSTLNSLSYSPPPQVQPQPPHDSQPSQPPSRQQPAPHRRPQSHLTDKNPHHQPHTAASGTGSPAATGTS